MSTEKPLPFIYQFIAGAVAGVSEILIMYPLDVVKTRVYEEPSIHAHIRALEGQHNDFPPGRFRVASQYLAKTTTPACLIVSGKSLRVKGEAAMWRGVDIGHRTDRV
jgi:hypothetical protein